MNWTNVLTVFIGSGIGGACRFLCSRGIQALVPQALFPWGTFTVNLAGCLVIGLLYGVFDRLDACSPEIRLLLTVGFCGGFTTFFTFINENYLLFHHSIQNALIALLYVLASVAIGFVMLYIGYKIASLF